MLESRRKAIPLGFCALVDSQLKQFHPPYSVHTHLQAFQSKSHKHKTINFNILFEKIAQSKRGKISFNHSARVDIKYNTTAGPKYRT